MQWSSALELQAAIFQKVFQFEELASANSDGLAAEMPTYIDPRAYDASLNADRLVDLEGSPTTSVAIGISGAGEGADEGARIAILVQDERLLRSSLIDDITSLSKGEAEAIFIGEQRALWTQNKNIPLRIGCSTSPQSVQYSGTIGCFGRDAQSGAVGFLSNNHVLSDCNALQPGAKIIQQGAGDGGHPTNDIVATLLRYVPLHLGGLPNAVDAAFATLDDGHPGIDQANIYDSGNPPGVALSLNPSGVATAFPSMDVCKTGRTTRHTTGKVVAVNVNNYMVKMPRGTVARFDGQITFDAGAGSSKSFSASGDSGSLIVDSAGLPVALLFAGSSKGGSGNLGITAGNPISSVIRQLGISII